MALYTLHLFAGAGGGILADLLLGHTIVGAVEIEQYPRDALLRRQQDGALPIFPIWDDVCTFRYDNPDTREFIQQLRNIRHQLCICGGFPCTDVSVAGKGAGIHGKQTGLWKEFARIIGEIRPQYAFMENSPALLRRGFTEVLKDLAEMGYDAAWGIVSAKDAGAPHERKRWWCLAADSDSKRELQPEGSFEELGEWAGNRGQDVSNADGAGFEKQCRTLSAAEELIESELHSDYLSNAEMRLDVRRVGVMADGEKSSTFDGGGTQVHDFGERREVVTRVGGIPHGLAEWLDRNLSGTVWREDEYDIARLVSTIPNRVARLKALGNGQVPQAAAIAFRALKENLEALK